PEDALETIYFGSGTPSLLPPDALATLLTSLRDAFPVTSFRDDVEVTLEANPEDVRQDAATSWRRAGVNRICLGAQSFDDRALQWMHRSHDAARIGAAVRTLRAAGIDNISLDLIFALPAELARDWGRDLERALALLPAHLSLYGLTVEERTPLARWISRGYTLRCAPTRGCLLPPSPALYRPLPSGGWSGVGQRSGTNGWCVDPKAGSASTHWCAT